jgi:hypothetical protein
MPHPAARTSGRRTKTCTGNASAVPSRVWSSRSFSTRSSSTACRISGFVAVREEEGRELRRIAAPKRLRRLEVVAQERAGVAAVKCSNCYTVPRQSRHLADRSTGAERCRSQELCGESATTRCRDRGIGPPKTSRPKTHHHVSPVAEQGVPPFCARPRSNFLEPHRSRRSCPLHGRAVTRFSRRYASSAANDAVGSATPFQLSVSFRQACMKSPNRRAVVRARSGRSRRVEGSGWHRRAGADRAVHLPCATGAFAELSRRRSNEHKFHSCWGRA